VHPALPKPAECSRTKDEVCNLDERVSCPRCVSEYLKGTELEPVPEILSGDAARDEVHRLYDEIVMSDTEVDKLVRNTPVSTDF
jgi:hypothetical protein